MDLEYLFIILLLFVINYLCMNMTIIFIHNFYFTKINTFISTSIIPNIKNFVPTLYEPSHFFEIGNNNPLIIKTNKYIDQNIYIINNGKIENFYKYTKSLHKNKNNIEIFHNYKNNDKIFFLFF